VSGPHSSAAGDDRHDDAVGGHGSLARRFFAHGPTPEERLAELIERHRRTLDEQASRFEETLTDLERREQLLSDSRASVERLLRRGTTDLEAREAEVSALLEDLARRELRLREREEELARRRGELGAVELKRLAVEQRERSLEAREKRLETLETRLAEHGAIEPDEDAPPGKDAVALALVPGVGYGLAELAAAVAHPGDSVEIDGVEYVVLRIGPSPLPGDRRRCAYLVEGPRRGEPSGGSS